MLIKPLTWALVIATYQREHILPRCLRLAAQQTRAPKEIIVVDASPGWETTRDLIRQQLSASYPHIKLIYVQAKCPSSTAQRNQGIDLSNSDVLFLIDDDSLMYPDCAEEIMRVYEADVDEVIQGVSAIAAPNPPDLEVLNQRQEIPSATLAAQPRQTRLRRWVKSLLSTEQTYFLPYDAAYPAHEIPPHLYELNIGVIQVMAGYAMTFRRSILQQERFNEVLERYAAGEDQDLSYRVSRHGAIVNAVNARLCHLEISGGRLSRDKVAALAGLNPAVLQQFYSSDREQTNRNWRKILRQRILIYFLKDLSDKDWRLSRTRGVLFALAHLQTIWAKSPEELLQWYPAFQAQLVEAR